MFFACNLNFAIANAGPIKFDNAVNYADAVFFGVVVSNHDLLRDGTSDFGAGRKYSVVMVTRVLKGSVSDTVKFIFHYGVTELDPKCCVVGKIYLFTAQKSGEFYTSMGAMFGAVEISNPSELSK